ncbi:MAG: TatD family nuclease-associated radical SAM protein [Candidatus Bathycorpusculaceae bacterium]
MNIRRSPSIVYWLENTLYLNVTNKCHNNCYFCLKNFMNGVGGFNLKLQNEPSIDEVIRELQNFINMRNWKEIVCCGFGEPLERLDCTREVAKWIRQYYGKIVDIRVDTNGHGFLLNKNRDVLSELKEAGVNKVSVSLNAHNKETYNQICRPTFSEAFDTILEFIKKAKEKFDVEITAVAVPEVNMEKIEEISREIAVRFRRREYISGFW